MQDLSHISIHLFYCGNFLAVKYTILMDFVKPAGENCRSLFGGALQDCIFPFTFAITSNR